jgi:hypothetical protein
MTGYDMTGYDKMTGYERYDRIRYDMTGYDTI